MRIANLTINFTMSFLAVIFLATTAIAHNGSPVTQDICTRVSGKNMIHFNAYQEKPDPRINYCNDIPNTGETSIIVDLVSSHLRKIPITFKIYSTNEKGKGDLIFDGGSKIYSSGLINAVVDIKKAGTYLAEVIIEGNKAPPPTLAYNIGVGSSISLHLPRSLTVLLTIVTLLVLAWGTTRLIGLVKKQ